MEAGVIPKIDYINHDTFNVFGADFSLASFQFLFDL